MKAKYAILLLLTGAVFLGVGILLIMLASSVGGSLAAIWTVMLHALAFMWPNLCNGCDFTQQYEDSGSSGLGDMNGVVAARTRVWVFILVSLMIVCQGSVIWTSAVVYSGEGVVEWPGIALSLNCMFQMTAGILFFATR